MWTNVTCSEDLNSLCTRCPIPHLNSCPITPGFSSEMDNDIDTADIETTDADAIGWLVVCMHAVKYTHTCIEEEREKSCWKGEGVI